MRISDWSSDVCSSDLPLPPGTLVVAASAASPGFGSFPARQGLGGVPRGSSRNPFHGLPHPHGDGFRCALPILRAHVGAGLQITELPSERSEERRVGKECVSPGRSRWSPYH